MEFCWKVTNHDCNGHTSLYPLPDISLPYAVGKITKARKQIIYTSGLFVFGELKHALTYLSTCKDPGHTGLLLCLCNELYPLKTRAADIRDYWKFWHYFPDGWDGGYFQFTPVGTMGTFWVIPILDMPRWLIRILVNRMR